MKTEDLGSVLGRRMRSEESLGQTDKVIKKKKASKRVTIQLRRPVYSVSWTLQQLFEACVHVFKSPRGFVPSTDDVKRLCQILDRMKPEYLGLSRNLGFFNGKSEVDVCPRVTSATIYKCESFEMCIFFLPATSVIPLHNHPEMTVFSKLLIGDLHIKAYDWADQSTSTSPSNCRLAELKIDAEVSAPVGTSVLYPTTGGNLHEFRAITPCAILDILGPPYSKNDNRDCSYYRETEHGFPSETGELKPEVNRKSSLYRYLEEIEAPKESVMDGIEYMGPRLIVPAS